MRCKQSTQGLHDSDLQCMICRCFWPKSESSNALNETDMRPGAERQLADCIGKACPYCPSCRRYFSSLVFAFRLLELELFKCLFCILESHNFLSSLQVARLGPQLPTPITNRKDYLPGQCEQVLSAILKLFLFKTSRLAFFPLGNL
jgi:hypothetical protein